MAKTLPHEKPIDKNTDFAELFKLAEGAKPDKWQSLCKDFAGHADSHIQLLVRELLDCPETTERQNVLNRTGLILHMLEQVKAAVTSRLDNEEEIARQIKDECKVIGDTIRLAAKKILEERKIRKGDDAADDILRLVKIQIASAKIAFALVGPLGEIAGKTKSQPPKLKRRKPHEDVGLPEKTNVSADAVNNKTHGLPVDAETIKAIDGIKNEVTKLDDANLGDTFEDLTEGIEEDGLPAETAEAAKDESISTDSEKNESNKKRQRNWRTFWLLKT